MASIVKRGKGYCVVYTYKNDFGQTKQKWESYKTKSEAEKRRAEIEYRKTQGTFTVKECLTVQDLVAEYIELYGKSKWAMSTYKGNLSLFDNYILPILGQMKLTDINARVIEQYYRGLLGTNRITPKQNGKPVFDPKPGKVTPLLIREIHKLLSSCFNQAVRWELMEKNPCKNATCPKAEKAERAIWTLEDLKHALDVCEDDQLKLCINLAFSCTLRIGELVGLTWDCVNISESAMQCGYPYIVIEKEMQRVDRAALKALDSKDVIYEFPSVRERGKTTLVLKKPKTESSIRKIYLPMSAARMLAEWKEKQEQAKEALGSEYKDYNLVICGAFGNPIEGGAISEHFRNLVKRYDLPPVVFHSLRHSSITYKLKLNGGDIKAVQGDSGHAQAAMVTEQYSHVLTDGQQNNADLIEKYFYEGRPIPERQAGQSQISDDADTASALATLTKLLSNPETAALIKALAKSL